MKKIFFLIVVSVLLLTFLPLTTNSAWSEQTSGVTGILKSVSAPDNSNVWVCGYLGVVLKSTNSGLNWVSVTGNGIPTTVSLVNIFGINSTNAIVAGYTGTNTWVWRTTNSGANWTQVYTETNGFIDAIWMMSNTNGIMLGDPNGGRWSIWKTSNGGANWDSSGCYLAQNGSEAGWNNSLMVVGTQIWFGTNNTRVYYSSNSGTSWTAQTTTGEINTYAVWFDPLMPGPIGFAGGTEIVKTTNYGTNWAVMSSIGTSSFTGITSTNFPVTDPLQQGLIYFTRQTSSIYFTPNAGTNWSINYTAPAGTYWHITAARIIAGNMWAVRSNGGISAYMNPGAIRNINTTIPDNYKLAQNFPNPFNPTTNIMFDIPKVSNVKLTVFDVLGKEVTVLVNEQMKAGSYEVGWDASNFTSGVYFYRMTAGDFSLTKRMILVK